MDTEKSPKPEVKRSELKLFSKERREFCQKLYHSPEWRKKSKEFKEANPWCIRCEKRGKKTPTKVADHKNPLWDDIMEGELIPLCKKCDLDKWILEDLPALKMHERTRFKFF